MTVRDKEHVVPLRDRMDSGFHTGQLNEDFVDDIASLIEKATDDEDEEEDKDEADDVEKTEET